MMIEAAKGVEIACRIFDETKDVDKQSFMAIMGLAIKKWCLANYDDEVEMLKSMTVTSAVMHDKFTGFCQKRDFYDNE